MCELTFMVAQAASVSVAIAASTDVNFRMTSRLSGALIPALGSSIPARPIELEKPCADERVEEACAGCPVEHPQAHGLIDRQSHARHLAVFTAHPSEQVVFLARSKERHRAGFVRPSCHCFDFTRRAHTRHLFVLKLPTASRSTATIRS